MQNAHLVCLQYNSARRCMCHVWQIRGAFLKSGLHVTYFSIREMDYNLVEEQLDFVWILLYLFCI